MTEIIPLSEKIEVFESNGITFWRIKGDMCASRDIVKLFKIMKENQSQSLKALLEDLKKIINENKWVMQKQQRDWIFPKLDETFKQHMGGLI